jgi:hypothetical protein
MDERGQGGARAVAISSIRPANEQSTPNRGPPLVPQAHRTGSSPAAAAATTITKPTSITAPLEQHIARRSSSRPNLIVNWVHRLEKINATLDEHPREGQSTSPGLGQRASRATTSSCVGAKTQAPPIQHRHHVVTIIGGNQAEGGRPANDEDEEEEGELCFKGAQLVTELLLMLFAASLLLVAAIVALSNQVPDFMKSYEIVPTILFFLCVIVASYSFLRWLVVKLAQRFEPLASLLGLDTTTAGKGDGRQDKNNESAKKTPAQSGGDNARQPPEGGRQGPVERDGSGTGSERRKSTLTSSYGTVLVAAAAAAATTDSDPQARVPLLVSAFDGEGATAAPESMTAPQDKSRPSQQQGYHHAHHHHRHHHRPLTSHGEAAATSAACCRAPVLRQVAFDPCSLLADDSDQFAISEEDSDLELSCASA